MSDNTIGLNPLLAGLQAKAQQATHAKAGGSTSGTLGGGKVGQDEFLLMLVTQLKNQDPLDPMKNEQFAVDLAQFSQLERLISIDDKLSNQSTDTSSFAAYLGNEVVLNSDTTQVKDGQGGSIHFQLIAPAAEGRIELLDSTGRVVGSVETGELSAGRHRIALNELEVPNGEYQVQVVVQGASGNESSVPANVGGVITGFIPGEIPTLLMEDREVKVSDVTMISVPR